MNIQEFITVIKDYMGIETMPNTEGLVARQQKEVESLEQKVFENQQLLEKSRKKLVLRVYVTSNIEEVKATGEVKIVQPIQEIFFMHDLNGSYGTDEEVLQAGRFWRQESQITDISLQRKFMQLHSYEFEQWEKTYQIDRHLGYEGVTWKIRMGHDSTEYAHGIDEWMESLAQMFKSRKMSGQVYSYLLNTPVEQIYAHYKSTLAIAPKSKRCASENSK